MNFRNAAIGAGGLLCAAGMTITIAGTAQADPPGNNGTLKVHELGTQEATTSNDPHVCKFNFEYFFQDSNQPGYDLTIKPQGGNGGPGSLTLTMPAANADGYSYSFYINADPGDESDGYTLADGHYKATVMGKNGETKDEKAKSKVFWVDCTNSSSSSSPSESSSSSSSPSESSSSSSPSESSSSSSSPSESSSSSSSPSESSSSSSSPSESSSSSSSPSESSSSSSSPSDSTSSSQPSTPTTPPEETTSTSSTGAVPPGSTTTPGASGPVVVTDGPSGGGDNTALLGGGLAAVGVALAGAGLLRRRMNE